MTQVRFHPQAWVRDYAIEVDPEGETVFEVGEIRADIEDDTWPPEGNFRGPLDFWASGV